jgi:tetratricopeptide (TPR) repeat protein
MADSALFAHTIRGAAEGQLGKYAAATADTQTVVAAHPNHAEYWTDCAWYQFKSGRLSAAITTARDGLQLSDASALDYFNLGLYYAMANDENAARNTYAAGLQFRDAATALPGARADIADELKAHPGNPLLLKAHGWLAVR